MTPPTRRPSAQPGWAARFVPYNPYAAPLAMRFCRTCRGVIPSAEFDSPSSVSCTRHRRVRSGLLPFREMCEHVHAVHLAGGHLPKGKGLITDVPQSVAALCRAERRAKKDPLPVFKHEPGLGERIVGGVASAPAGVPVPSEDKAPCFDGLIALTESALPPTPETKAAAADDACVSKRRHSKRLEEAGTRRLSDNAPRSPFRKLAISALLCSESTDNVADHAPPAASPNAAPVAPADDTDSSEGDSSKAGRRRRDSNTAMCDAAEVRDWTRSVAAEVGRYDGQRYNSVGFSECGLFRFRCALRGCNGRVGVKMRVAADGSVSAVVAYAHDWEHHNAAAEARGYGAMAAPRGRMLG